MTPVQTGRRVEDVLDRVLDLIEDPQKWTQGSFARNAQGHPTGIYNDDVVCWCLSGALVKVLHSLAPNDVLWRGRMMEDTRRELSDTLRLKGMLHVNLIRYNDNVQHHRVIQLVKDTRQRLIYQRRSAVL